MLFRSPELAEIATSIRREVGRAISREVLLAALCNEVEAVLELSAAALVGEYRAASLVIGRDVMVTPVSGQPYLAVAESVAEDGSVVVVDGAGRREWLNAAEVTLRPAGDASRR